MRLKYTLPGIPPSENKYKGRNTAWEYRKDKKLWESIVAYCCKPPNEPVKRCVLTLTYFFRDKRRHDPNNYSGHFITDGLVKRGIIADDCFECIDLVLKGDYDKNNPRVEIVIEVIA